MERRPGKSVRRESKPAQKRKSHGEQKTNLTPSGRRQIFPEVYDKNSDRLNAQKIDSAAAGIESQK